MNGKAKLVANGQKTSVYGGQAFKKAVFPPTSYIQGLLNAYCPGLHFNAADFLSAFQKARTPDFDAAFEAVTPDGASFVKQLCWNLPPPNPLSLSPVSPPPHSPSNPPRPLSNQADFLSAFQKARTPDFDAAFEAVTPDGASCGQQLCWCLLDLPASTVLPLHAHKNLEVVQILKGVMCERAVSNDSMPVERQTALEVDWLDSGHAKLVERVFGAGDLSLNTPGSIHQVNTGKAEGCLMLILYSKDCTFIRATDPVVARQLLPATPERGTTYQMAPVSRTPSSFTSRDPRYARFRAQGTFGRQAAVPDVTVAQVVVKALADCGVRDAIVYPGAKCIELLKVIDNNNYGVKGWLCRNEHAGAFAAEGYNKSQGERLCAVVTTSGPGATNLCTGIASAWRDGVPMIILTSQVPTYKSGTSAFQEVPTTEIYRPITKGAFAVTSAAEAYEVVVSACKLAVEGVNGPVLVDLPEDVQALMVSLPHRHPHIATGMQQQPACGTASAAAAANGPSAAAAAAGGGSAAGTTSGGGAAFVTSPLGSHFGGWLAPEPAGFRSHTPNPISRAVMQEVLKSIRGAKRPLLLLGGGCVGCDEALLNELVEVLGVPVVYTFMGKGCLSDDHPLCLGPIGVHGLFTANTAVAQCDMVMALGCRFDERAACKSFELWQAPRKVVHVDIRPQPSMSGSPKNPIGVGVVADVGDFVGVLLQYLYGLLEERARTLSVPLSGLSAALGGSAIDELAEYEAFAVDDDDLATLRDTAQQRKETATDAGKDGGKKGPPEASSGSGASAAPSPFAKGSCSGSAGAGGTAAAADGVAAADAGLRAVSLRAVSMVSVADFNAGEFTYAEWAQEMSDMKVRRWKGLMPVLSAKSELTTREMVHLLDSYLSAHGLQPIVCSDVGSHQCLLAQYLRLHHPRQWLCEGGLASMGCGLPSAIGAAMANPSSTCLAVAGDGGFAMTSQELMMAKAYKLNVKVIVTVNNRLQLVEQLEEETFDSLDVFTFLGDPDHPNRPYPHFSKLAEAYGVPSVTAWTKQELLEGLSVMFSRPGPFLLEVVALAERPQIKYWDDSEQ